MDKWVYEDAELSWKSDILDSRNIHLIQKIVMMSTHLYKELIDFVLNVTLMNIHINSHWIILVFILYILISNSTKL